MLSQNEKDQIVNLLRSLGSSREEVYQNISALKIKGRKIKCATCPIAMYLAKNGANISNGDWYTLVYDYNSLRSIQSFIQWFDAGHYKELEID
jgi:hypothetical protein